MIELNYLYFRVYFGDIDEINDESFKLFFEQMPKYRQEKIKRLVFDKDKKLSLSAGILLNNWIEQTGVTISENDFIVFENGKCDFNDEFGFHFNQSHSQKKSMCVVGKTQIGCDIEKIDYDIEFKIAERFFTEKENEWLSLFDGQKEKSKAFFRLWTLKESFIKCVGDGLSIPLNSFEIVIDCKNQVLPLMYNNKKYYFTEIEYFEDYCCSVCRSE